MGDDACILEKIFQSSTSILQELGAEFNCTAISKPIRGFFQKDQSGQRGAKLSLVAYREHFSAGAQAARFSRAEMKIRGAGAGHRIRSISFERLSVHPGHEEQWSVQ